MRPHPIRPGPGQESVWDYPRPPRLERVPQRVRVGFGGGIIVDTEAAFRVLETSHPPTYYVPPTALAPGVLVPAGRGSVCEWKGEARYFDVVGGGARAARAAWSYPDPTGSFTDLKDHVAFYAGLMDMCQVGEDVVTPQPGGFYGGWITPSVVGPFKGDPGTWGW